MVIAWNRKRISTSAVLLVFALGIEIGLAEEAEVKVKINIAALDLATVARQAERITKRSFLFDDALLRVKKVTLQSDTPINAAEYYRVFQSVCQMHGFLLVPVDDAGIRLEKIVPTQGAFKEPARNSSSCAVKPCRMATAWCRIWPNSSRPRPPACWPRSRPRFPSREMRCKLPARI